MNSFKRVTKEQADALVEAGGNVTETAYLLRIKWSTENPEYCSHEVPVVRTLGPKPNGTVVFRRMHPFPSDGNYSSTLPVFTVEVE